MEFMTIKEAAEKWNLSVRRVQTICNEGMIEGAMKFGNTWAIPKNAVKPADKVREVYQVLILGQQIWENGLERKSMPMLPEEKARVKIDKQLRNAGWDIVARNEYLPNSIDGTAIRIQFKISGLSKIKDILTEINEEGKHDRNDGFKTASKASQFDFLD